MLQRLAIWLATLKGKAMKKHMVGDTYVVVIDEVGEVTFNHQILEDTVEHISDHETAQRAIAACYEMIEICERLLGPGQVGAKLTSAQELLLVNWDHAVDRLSERIDFNRGVRKG